MILDANGKNNKSLSRFFGNFEVNYTLTSSLSFDSILKKNVSFTYSTLMH